jgi:hypothetical protein
MPTARSLAQTIAGRTVPLAISIALAIAFAPFTTTRTASACPMANPLPLRTLYMKSELIVVARLGATTPVKFLSSNEDGTYTRYLMRTDLKVASTVKGQSNHGVVPLYHWGWTTVKGQYQHSHSANRADDKLLIFLKPRKGEEGYEMTDSTYGLKKLSDADLKVYLRLIDELALILQQEKPDPAQIVEWLVRCVEEPATRWEGLYELSSSNYALRNNQKKAKAETDEAGAVNPTGDDVSGQAADSSNRLDENSVQTAAETDSEQIVNLPLTGRFYIPEPSFVQLLTASQKSRLSNVIFNAKTLSYNELPLISLIHGWNEPRLIPFIMSQLRGFVDDPPQTAQTLVMFMAETLKDEEATKLAEKYCENAFYDMDGIDIRSEELIYEETESPEEAQEEEAQEELTESDAAEEPVFGNYKQKRSIRLQRFIARVESVMAIRVE